MNFFKNKLSKFQLKALIKELEGLDYDAIINGLDWMAIEFAKEEDESYFKAIVAIKKCMLELKEMYKKEG